MKLQTQYETMTNQQLVQELEHRANTFGDSLSTYTAGAERCTYKGTDYYFGMFDDQHASFSLIQPENYDHLGDEVIIHTDNPLYRDLLLQLLQSPFIVIHTSSSKEEDQQQYLEDMKCIECSDNTLGHLMIKDDSKHYWILDLEDEE